MDGFATLPTSERQLYCEQTAARMSVNSRIIEKDFWVCWVLQELFALPEIGGHLTFKGGTSLSKVYRAIDRFSEDIDVSIERDYLGFGNEAGPEAAHLSRKESARRIEALKLACQKEVHDRLKPALGERMRNKLLSTDNWQLKEDDDDCDRQTLLFFYPGAQPGRRDAYIRPAVKIELGARSDHWPREYRQVTPYVAEHFPAGFRVPSCSVNVLQAERTFWEKATILHSYYYMPAGKLLPPRLSRHYYDLAQLISRDIGAKAALEPELLARVVEHKNVFFRSAWANYDSAKKGTLRLAPPVERLHEWQGDYAKMGEMFFGRQFTFTEVLGVVREFEEQFNHR